MQAAGIGLEMSSFRFQFQSVVYLVSSVLRTNVNRRTQKKLHTLTYKWTLRIVVYFLHLTFGCRAIKIYINTI